MTGRLRRAAHMVARKTLGRLPRPAAARSGPLAADGGIPVRDQRLRPWQSSTGAALRWLTSVGPRFRQVYLSGEEGLPQTQQKRFAARWAERCGCRYGVLLPHGTDALRFGLAAALDHDGLDYGGEVVVPNLSFIASATAALDRRFGVAFVDVDANTLNLDPAAVERAVIPGRTRAIMAVHQFGQPADMTALRVVAARHDLIVIEDAAQAHGAVWESGPVGSLGDAAAFSFQSAKNLTAGEGGILTTNDRVLYERVHSLHNTGRVPEVGSRWEHATLGWNCRPTEYQAALLLARLEEFDGEQQRRRHNWTLLLDRLAGVSCVSPLQVHRGVRQHGMYMFVLRYFPDRCGGVPIDEFVTLVRAEGIPLHRGYDRVLSEQGVMQTLRQRRPEYVRVLPTPVADQAVTSIVYLAGSLFLGDERDMHDIADAIRKVEQRRGGSR